MAMIAELRAKVAELTKQLSPTDKPARVETSAPRADDIDVPPPHVGVADPAACRETSSESEGPAGCWDGNSDTDSDSESELGLNLHLDTDTDSDGHSDTETQHEAATRLKVYKTLTAGMRSLPRRARLQLLKSVASPTKLKEGRLVSQLAQDAGVNRRSLTSPPTVVKTDRTLAAERRNRLIVEFLCDPEHSTTLPGIKDTVTINKIKYQKVILLEFTAQLHQKFCDWYPEQACCLSTFRKVRRANKYIKPVKYNTTSVCLCVKHQNFTLMLRAVRVFQLPDIVLRASSREQFTQMLRDKDLPDPVVCKTWQYVDVPYGPAELNKKARKLRLLDSSVPKEEYILAMAEEFATMYEHSERARIQHQVVRHLRERMSSEECTIQMDFAENWMVSYPEEPQSVYYSKEPVTLHPAVIHYRDVVTGDTKHRSLALVTDDRRHDTGAILAFLRVIARFIRENLPGTVRMLHYVSDSPSSQYRNVSIFSILCKHQQLFDGLAATWTYFEAGHGKGPCDGVGAAAKRNADDAVKRQQLIQDADDFAKQGNRMEGKVVYECVPVPVIVAARDEVLQLVAKKSLDGTMQFHSVVPVVPSQSVAVRSTSCFDDCCWEGCVSRRGCPGWSVRVMFPTTPTQPARRGRRQGGRYVVPDSSPEPNEAARVEQRAPRVVEEYDVGDWVVCVYDGQWYLGKVCVYDGEYLVTFMRRTTNNNSAFVWPHPKDELEIPPEDMLMRTVEPAPYGSARRVTAWHLPPDVLASADAKLEEWQVWHAQ